MAAQPKPDGAQHAFVQALLDPDAPVPPTIAPGQARRFDVYRNNVIVSLIEALGDAYPAVKNLVGEEFFNAAAGLFVRAHPPRSPLMIYYGAGFAEWLETFEPAAGLPYLPDVARLERIAVESLNAADAPILSAEGFGAAAAGLAPEQLAELRLLPHPATHAFSSTFPIVSIRQKALGGDAGELKGAECALISRPADLVLIAAAPAGADVALQSLNAGEALGAAAEAATKAGGDFGAVLTALLQSGALSAVSGRDATPPISTKRD